MILITNSTLHKLFQGYVRLSSPKFLKNDINSNTHTVVKSRESRRIIEAALSFNGEDLIGGRQRAWLRRIILEDPWGLEKLTSGRWGRSKLVWNGNLVLSACSAGRERRRKKDGVSVNWDRCAVSMGAPRTCGRGPASLCNREKGSYAGSGLTKLD